MSQNLKTVKVILGRYYRALNSRLALKKLAILNAWNKKYKDRSHEPKQCRTPVRADTTYIAVNANAHGRKTHPGMSACARSGVTS